MRLEDLDASLPADFAPALMKIDVEGAEEQVLRGARRRWSATGRRWCFEHSSAPPLRHLVARPAAAPRRRRTARVRHRRPRAVRRRRAGARGRRGQGVDLRGSPLRRAPRLPPPLERDDGRGERDLHERQHEPGRGRGRDRHAARQLAGQDEREDPLAHAEPGGEHEREHRDHERQQEARADEQRPARVVAGEPADRRPHADPERGVRERVDARELPDAPHREQRLERLAAQPRQHAPRQRPEHPRMEDQQPERDGGDEPQPGPLSQVAGEDEEADRGERAQAQQEGLLVDARGHAHAAGDAGLATEDHAAGDHHHVAGHVAGEQRAAPDREQPAARQAPGGEPLHEQDVPRAHDRERAGRARGGERQEPRIELPVEAGDGIPAVDQRGGEEREHEHARGDPAEPPRPAPARRRLVGGDHLRGREIEHHHDALPPVAGPGPPLLLGEAEPPVDPLGHGVVGVDGEPDAARSPARARCSIVQRGHARCRPPPVPARVDGDPEGRHREALVPAAQHREGDDLALGPRRRRSSGPRGAPVSSVPAVAAVIGNGVNVAVTAGTSLRTRKRASASSSAGVELAEREPVAALGGGLGHGELV